MDMMMPKMNGYVATKHIKEEIDSSIPVYIVSAYKKEDFPADWQSVDYEDVLEKPVALNMILDIINKHNV
jgi:CheY-like chemotaxis protein